jgi:Carboxypeptidase regulatory-like domain
VVLDRTHRLLAFPGRVLALWSETMICNRLGLAETLCLIMWACIFVQTTSAQNASTGALTGLVTDASGGVVRGAEVKITNEGTGDARVVRSQSDGSYSATLLAAGSYRVDAKHDGFKTSSYEHVIVVVSETARLNIQLDVGSATETVEVVAPVEDLQTQSAELGTVTDGRYINNLPLVTRNFTQILGLNPGISTELTNAGDLGRGNGSQNAGANGFSANGNPTNDNNFQMNGVEVNDVQGSGFFSGGVPIPNPDTIQEFKVVTQPYDASSGRDAGANVDLVTKSGTNAFHGTVFEYFRNEDLNANEFFRNGLGEPRPELRENQFGFTLGGPIIKDKLFFFGSYQGTRQLNGLDPNCSSIVKTPPLTNDRSQAALGQLYAGQGSYAVLVGPPGAGTTIDASGDNINPAALQIMQAKLPDGSYLVPTPTVIDPTQPFDSQGTIAFSIACPFSEDQYMFNADYVQSAKSKFTGRVFAAQSSLTETLPETATGGGAVPGSPQTQDNAFRNIALLHTYTFNSSIVNQASIGYNRSNVLLQQQVPFDYSDFGITVPSFDNDHPNLLIGNMGIGGNGQSSHFVENTYTAQDTLTYVRGRHTFHFGGGVTRLQDNQVGFTFYGLAAFLDSADFMLGLDAAGTGVGLSDVFETIDVAGFTGRAYRIWEANSYVQDDIKVSSRFTLNAGFRYERVGDFADALGRNVSFFPNLANPDATSPTLQGYVVPSNFSGTVPAGVTKLGNEYGILGNGQNTWNPRLGFAWQLPHTQRFVLRGGYGTFHSRSAGNAIFQSVASPPFAIVREGGAAFGDPTPSLEEPLPPFDLSTLPSFTPAEYYGPTNCSSAGVCNTPGTSQVFNGFAPDYRPPLVQHFSLDVQTELAKGLVWDIGYVGDRATHVLEDVLTNQASIATPTDPVRGLTTTTLANLPERVPIEGFGTNGLIEFESGASNWYNALQTSLNKHFTNGLQFLVSYTFARSLGTANGISNGPNGAQITGNQFDPRESDYGPDPFVREQRLVISYYYEFPHPKELSSWKGRLLGGWGVSGVTVAQSGQRLPVTFQDPDNAYGILESRPNYVAGCKVGMPGATSTKLGEYFNTACFTPPPVIGNEEPNPNGNGCVTPLPDGNCPAVATAFGNSPIGIITGPGEINFDFSIIKRTALHWPTEAANLEFRSEFYNIFNHPEFGAPNTTFDTTTFGQITGPTILNPRVIQFALKWNF